MIKFSAKNKGKICADNAINWDYIDEVYEKSFTKDKTVGNVAFDSGIAFGASCIQKKLDLTDA